MNKHLFLLFALFLSTVCSAEKYVGKVGDYDVSVVINEPTEYSLSTMIDVTGKYTYTKAGNSLNLSGYLQGWPGLGGDPDQRYPRYVLEETTKSGKVSANWLLFPTERGHLEGTMKLTKNGQTFKVYLRPVQKK